MPQVNNPHKKFQWSIFLFGMNPFLAQKCTLPDRDVEQVEHGEGNYISKTAGMVKLANIVVEKIQPGTVKDVLIYSWIKTVQDEFGGGGSPAEVYKKAIQVQFLSVNGSTSIKTYNYLGAWPCKINGIELDRLSSDNTIESIEFSVDQEAVV